MTSTVVATAKAPAVSTHVGAVGDTVHLLGVIRKIIGGGKALYVMHDINGNEFVMRCTKYQAPGKQVRSLVDVYAKVLGHTEYAGVKRTELSATSDVLKVSDDHPFLAH